jgi:uncharacterized SAM-binding protein YcdF (DUF218 family)
LLKPKGAGIAMNSRRPALRALIVVAVVLSAWALVAPTLAQRLIVERPLDRADAILVLAGSTAYVQRTRMAAILYNQGVAPRILLTNDGMKAGWSQDEQRNPPFVELARRRLVAEGVPEGAIETLPQAVSGTNDEATLVRKAFADRRWKSLLIVTSSSHTRRALRTFDRTFSANSLETRIGIVAAPDGEGALPASFWWLTPSGWRNVAGEYVKGAYYDLAY